MWTLFLICAAVGGTVMVCQFVLTLLGMSGDHDIGGDHDVHFGDHGPGLDHHDVAHEHFSSWFVGILTFRSIVAAVTFFGLGGLGALAGEQTPQFSLLVGLAAGTAALFLVAWLMQGLHKLTAEGTTRIERSVGTGGTVYLSIPGQKAGCGKVHVNLQNRTMEYQAITPNEELPTGAKIVVTGVIGPNTVEVISAISAEKVSHV